MSAFSLLKQSGGRIFNVLPYGAGPTDQSAALTKLVDDLTGVSNV
jgi:hypothetical protein